MRKVLTLLGIAASLAATSSALAEQQTVTLAVDNMYCALCPLTVKKAIERVEGVAAVEVDFDRKQAVVTFDNTRTNWQALASASTDAGYPARSKDAT